MKKILFFITALLLMGGLNANAEKKYADLSKLQTIGGTNATWDTETSTITWIGKSNNMVTNFDFAAGDYKYFSNVVVSVSELNNANFVRVQIRANGKEKTAVFSGTGTTSKSMISDFGFEVADIEYVEWIRLLGSNWDDPHTINADNTASAKIESVYVESPSNSINVDLSKMAASAGTATWDKETGTFAWTGTWSNSIALPGLTGNLSAYTTLNYETVAGTADHFRILVYYSNGAAQTTYYATVGTKSVTFEEMGVVRANLASVSSINISGASDVTGNIHVSSVSIEGPAVNYIEATEVYEAPAGTTDLNDVAGSYTELKINYPKKIVGEAATLCGDGNGDKEEKNADISDYDYLCFEITEVSGGSSDLRVWVWDGTKVVTLRPHPVAEYANVQNWTEKYNISTPGTYAVKVSDYDKLKGAKTNWGSSATMTVSMAYLGKGTPVEYVPSGIYTLVGGQPGTTSLSNAMKDANAVFYDATGVTGTDVDLTGVVNKNALFKANEGVLANTSNVIVDNSIANLVLTDGGGTFKTSEGYFATSASFDRVFVAGQPSTICLPYGLSQQEAEDAGDFYQFTGVEDSKLVFTKISATKPYEPFLFKAKANGAIITTESKDIQASVYAYTSYERDGYTFKGVLTNSSDVAADNPDCTVYGWDAETGEFIKVGENVSINAFRAYITINNVNGNNPARLAAKFVDDSVTGINEVNGSEAKNADGKFFENGKIVIIKNGVKYSAAGALLK